MEISLKVLVAVLGLSSTGVFASLSDKEFATMKAEAMDSIEQDIRNQIPSEMAKQFQMMIEILPQDHSEEKFVHTSSGNKASEDTI